MQLSRNVNSSHSVNPIVNINRSSFDRSSSVKLSFNVGELIPFYVDEVLPGDTFNVKTSRVVRLQTLIAPVMDNLYLDTYFFYVPNRIVWNHWRELCGENTQSAWISPVEYSIPQTVAPAGGWDVGTIADYMGIPPKVAGLKVNSLPFRAYAMICNEWFRDQNLSDPLLVHNGDANTNGSNGSNAITDIVAGGRPYICAKYHDYFTSCLPSPQKGPDVTINVSDGGLLPVVPKDQKIPSNQFTTPSYWYQTSRNTGIPSSITQYFVDAGNSAGPTSVNMSASAQGTGNNYSMVPNNLYAVDDGSISSVSVNQLRMAFQIQKMYEKDARGGTRYIELLKAHFGVTSPDSRLQRPEYLGGNRLPITISQVVQNSETGSTPQGNVSGYSLTHDTHRDFKQSFVEHGFVLGLMVARYPHTYQQGIERFWSRKTRFDYYWPALANIGEQAVLNKEIYAQGSAVDEQVFGYQEAWADYRYKPNRVSGEMRSTAPAPLDLWHFADHYNALPMLSDAWIREERKAVDRTLAVSSEVSNQLIADIFVKNVTTRPMPVNSIPGLVDHH